MGNVHSFLHSEDLDLNAAAATIAAALGQRNCILPDADTIKLPDEDGMWLKRIMSADETAGGLGGYSEFLGKGSERKFRFGKNPEIGDLLRCMVEFEDETFPMLKGGRIKVVGNKSGTGAEQHNVIHDIYIPSLPDVEIYNGPVKHYHMLGVVTGTLVANTISGLNSVLGDETALQDSEIQFPEDPGKEYVLKGFWPVPGGAGYGALGFRHPNGKMDRLAPAVFASAIQAPYYPLNWKFTGDAPPRAIGCGVGTTSTELTMLLGEIN